MKKRILALATALILLCLAAAPALGAYAYNYNRDYIIADSGSRRLSESELWGYTRETLRYIRNEILARHGYGFTMNKFFNYFAAKTWYVAGGYGVTQYGKLSGVEWDNISTVKRVEKAMDEAKTTNPGGLDITTVIAYQNSQGGYGNQNYYGAARGTGNGAVAGDGTSGGTSGSGSGSSSGQISVKPVTPVANYIYNRRYIIPDSNTRRLTESELWAYTRETLRYIRNELLARHGYAFGSNKFARYFKTKDWYTGEGYENAHLSSVEWDNISLVKKVERSMDALKTENQNGLDIVTIINAQNAGTYPGRD